MALNRLSQNAAHCAEGVGKPVATVAVHDAPPPASAPGLAQEVADSQVGGPVVEIGLVELSALDAKHVHDVGPLSIGNLDAEPIPFQLEQNDILGADDIKRSGIRAGRRRQARCAITERSKGRSLRTKTSTLKPVVVSIMLKLERARTACVTASRLM